MPNIAVIGNSYDKVKNLEQEVITAYQKEIIQKKREFPGRYFWRGTGKHRNLLKFNFLLNDVPLNSYGIISTLKSDNISEVYVVGNKATKATVNQLKRQFSTYMKSTGKKLEFVHEGIGLGGYPLHNTLHVARKAIGKNEQVFFLTGDTPNFDVDSVLSMKGIEGKDIVMNFNGKENINGRFLEKYPDVGVFPRYYHFAITHEGISHLSKESNGYILNLDDKILNTAQKFYLMRKGVGEQIKRYIKENIFKSTDTLMSIPWLGYMGAKSYMTGTPIGLSSDLLSFVAKSFEDINFFAAPLHRAPGNLEDIDSDLDYMLISKALEMDKTIYKHHEDISELRENMKSLEKRESSFKPANFAQYMNSFFDSINAPKIIDNTGKVKTDEIFTLYPQITEERLQDHNRLHQEYLNKTE
jgi:hypothetical protein